MVNFALCLALSLTVLGQNSEKTSEMDSSQDFALEFRLGPYRPFVDKAFSAGQGPYAKVFQKKFMLLSEIEFDWQFFHGFGSVGLGVAAGYAEVHGKALIETVPSPQTTSLKIMPMKLMLVWRMDIFANRFHVPVVPYAKLGLMLNHWWAAKGGETSRVDGNKASGWRSGWLGILGVALQLDAFDRQLARDLDTSMGINHTYVFAEYAFEQVQSFGKKGINLSAGHWMFGLAIEF